MTTNIEPKYYQALSEVTTAAEVTGPIQAVLCSIVENVAKEVRAKGCSLALLTPDKKFLRHMASYGLSEEYIKKGRILAEKSISEALQGRPVAVQNAAQDVRVQYPEEAAKEGITSILAVPIMLEEECLGVLRVYTAHPRHFTDTDIYFVRTAANMGATALENAVTNGDEADTPDYDTFRQQLVELEWARWPSQCP